jgi:hypothetical protein
MPSFPDIHAELGIECTEEEGEGVVHLISKIERPPKDLIDQLNSWD